MALFDHYHTSPTSEITPIGRCLVDLQNHFFIRLIKRYSTPQTSPSLLEIGPAQGYFADMCIKEGIPYMCLEANNTLSQNLTLKGYAVHKGLAPPIPIERTFDVIFMDQVFEHMRGRDEAVGMIKTCKDHLNPGGLLVISSPEILLWREDFYQDYTHNYPTSLPRLSQIISDNDFEVVYKKLFSFFLRGAPWMRLLAFFVRLLYAVGIFHLIFHIRADKVKTALLPNCIVIGRKRY